MREFSHKQLEEALSSPCIKNSGVAKLAGITPQYLTELMKGKYVPSANILVAIADTLNLPIDYFFVENCKNTLEKEPA